MVNWVQVQRKHLLARLAKNAGLRQHAVALDDEATVVNFWLPKDKNKHAGSAAAITEEGESTRQRQAVVLLHGFAGDGMMTWGFQVGALAKRGHDVYVPDLLHFGGSTSPSPDCSAGFQARCLATALGKLGVERCTVVGFSYGGLVAFEMAAACPGLVRSVVVSGAVAAYTGAMNDALLGRLAAGTLTELLLPESPGQLRMLFSTAMYMKLWLPDRLLKDFLKVMYTNRKERAELLEDTIITDKEAPTHVFRQVNDTACHRA